MVFRPYFGDLPPLLTATLICIFGFGAFYILNAFYRFEIYKSGIYGKSFRYAILFSIPFMIAVTLADLLLQFPKEINVSLPMGALFYPAIGYIAQIALHLVPFTILLILSESISKWWSVERRIWLSIILTASIEAIFQISGFIGDGVSALGIFIGIHLFLFGLAELYLFKRFDFVTMYLFRLFYYSYWHILWGEQRLQWLF